MAEVVLGYASSRNISFQGVWETGIEREEWDAMTEEEQNEVFQDAVNDLVEVWVEEDGDND